MPHFTVVSYNVEFSKYGSSSTVAAVGAADADIVCLQETGGNWEPALHAAYSKRYTYELHYPDGHPTGAMTVLSRYPVTDLGVQDAPSGWHPRAKRLRGSVKTFAISSSPCATQPNVSAMRRVLTPMPNAHSKT